ncbi:MAG: LITAF-like zinc ribbon domain-containing protein [Pyrinomonadaceae bacterium]|nr:LITAF-like zinc ribbon domain-containing protein [Pyrinomonadaceae bacterium]
MIQCTNCGQVNTETSHFCRFCGTKFLQTQSSEAQGFEYSPPRPYSWKTDEFQIAENKQPRPQPLNRVQPLPNPVATSQTFQPPQPLVYQPPQNFAHNYRCPRCANQIMPQIVKRISTAGWIVFALLMVMFFPLFWIGLLIKEEVRICPVCNFKLG